MRRVLLLLILVFSLSLVASVSYSFDRGETRSIVIEGVHYDISFVESDGVRSRFAVNNELTQSLRTGEYGFAGGLFVQAGQMSGLGVQSSGGLVEFCVTAPSQSHCALRHVLFEQESSTYFIEGGGDVEVSLISVSDGGARFEVNGVTTNVIAWDPDRNVPVTLRAGEVFLTVHDILRAGTDVTARAAFLSPQPLPHFPTTHTTSLGSTQDPQVLAYVDVNEELSREWLQVHMREVLSSDLHFTVKPVARDLGMDTDIILSLLCSAEQTAFFPFLYALVDQPRGVDARTRLRAAIARSQVSEAELDECVRADRPGADIQENKREWMHINNYGPVPVFVVGDDVLTGFVSVQDLSHALFVEPDTQTVFRYGLVEYSPVRSSITERLTSLFNTTPERVTPDVFDPSSFTTSLVFIVRDDMVLAMIGRNAVNEYGRLLMTGAQLFEEAGFRVQRVTTDDAVDTSIDQLFEQARFTGAPQPIEPSPLRVHITHPSSAERVSDSLEVRISTQGDVSRTEFFVEGTQGGMLSSLSSDGARHASFDVRSLRGEQILVVARAYDSAGSYVEDRVLVQRPLLEDPREPEPTSPVPPAPESTQPVPSEPVVCDGCSVDGRCLAVGMRLPLRGEPVYCSLSGELGEQRPLRSSCDNNFECQTNQCSSGICVDLVAEIEEARGMFERIANWFGRLFGR